MFDTLLKARRNRDRWAHRRAVIEHNRRKDRMMDVAAEHKARAEFRFDLLRHQILNGDYVAPVRPEADAELGARVGLLHLVEGGHGYR